LTLFLFCGKILLEFKRTMLHTTRKKVEKVKLKDYKEKEKMFFMEENKTNVPPNMPQPPRGVRVPPPPPRPAYQTQPQPQPQQRQTIPVQPVQQPQAAPKIEPQQETVVTAQATPVNQPVQTQVEAVQPEVDKKKDKKSKKMDKVKSEGEPEKKKGSAASFFYWFGFIACLAAIGVIVYLLTLQ